MAKIVVDRTRCTGLGICESVSPDHFEVDDDGELVVLREDVTPDEIATVREAVAGCPTGALSLDEG